jgi:triacylglycerol lipase
MLTLLFAFIAVMLGFAILTYGFFWYETANGPHRAHLKELSRGKVGTWVLRGIMTSFCSQWLVVLCFPLLAWRKLWFPALDPDSSRPPVFLIHGLYHNASAWILYRWWLRRAGFTNVYAWSYNSLNYSFEELTQRLDGWVAELMNERFPRRQAIMIGHSLGGLLIRAHSIDPEAARRILAIVTLGTPQRGSKLAVLGVGRLAHSLLYQGPLIRRLEQATPPDAVTRLAFTSPVDNMVLPQAALISSQPGWTQMATAPVSHVAMLYHWPTAQRLLATLEELTPQHGPAVRASAKNPKSPAKDGPPRST